MNKTLRIVLYVIAVIVIILAIIFGTSYCQSHKTDSETKSDSELALLAVRQADSICKLNALLEDCNKGRKVTYTRSTGTKRSTTVVRQKSIPEDTYTPEYVQPAQTQKAFAPATTPSRTENTGLAGDQYIGVFNGSHGATINENSQLTYFISNEELNAGEGKMNIAAPRLNSANGNEFFWDPSKNLWICETGTIITIADLLNQKTVVWCVYIGQNSEWNYSMFVPHEILKTGSASAMSALANGEVRWHNANNHEDGADYLSVKQFRKR